MFTVPNRKCDGSVSGSSVLVVDDDAVVRTYVRMILEREGLQLLEAADGVDGPAMLCGLRSAVDLLISDLRMPRMTGAELASRAEQNTL